ncbi:MAG: c-type cytochrome [Ignavibacteriales bacterium]|nr:c-type cytochrome [Ignavibacteriales bacterium]
MTKLRLSFALSGVVFFVVLAIAPLKDFFREWKWYQYEYNGLITELPRRVKPAEIGIKQLWVRGLDRIDRCGTCHLGLSEPALQQARQPFRAHPRIDHDFEEFGCTVCHEGQGAATTYKGSVGNVEYWDKPMYPTKFMEASCGKCHKEKEVLRAPILTFGRELIEESNCAACHRTEGFEKQWTPSLDGIGSKVNRSWLVNWLKNPKAYFAKTRMPNFFLTDDEVNILADFLMTLKTFPRDATLDRLPAVLTSGTEPQREKLAELGATRLSEARCISCHPINGRGGTVATELGKVASKVNAAWLYSYMKNPKRLQPGVEMPRYRFNETELAAVVASIQSEFVDYEMEERPPHTPDPSYFEKGRALFKKYNCSGCHELGGMTKAEEMGPDLTSIGAKKLYEIDFGKSSIEQALPSYLFTKVKSPRVFSPTMKMPSYEFTDEEAQAITVALLGSTEEEIPAQFKVQPKPRSTYAPQGEFGKLVDDLACFGCHTMFGRGRLVATDLTLEASQAQRKWIEKYFKIPYSLRPILPERMPNLFVSDAEIKVMVNYMEKVFIADSVEREVRVDQDSMAKGKILYYEKYGCQACHQINLKGGYVGPALDKAGSRLKPGWIFHWLKDPQAFKPETIEPKNNLTDEEAEALTVFLMSLK